MENNREISEAITQPVIVRGVSIGEGAPKICVSIVGDTIGAISAQANKIASLLGESDSSRKLIDIVEWRADWMPSVADGFGLPAVQSIRSILPDIPLIFTFRSQKEGGKQALNKDEYLMLVNQMILSGCIDIIDLELSTGDSILRKAIDFAHQNSIKVIASNHDFHGTPSVQEMVSRLTRMEVLGADILKIAVMPQEPRDTLKLLSASIEMYKRTPCPIVTIAMSNMGIVTRVCGEFSGSAVTFASMEQNSAPGQISVAHMRQILDVLTKTSKKSPASKVVG